MVTGAFSYLTAEIPGTGGMIKGSPEDFWVTELPAYEPSGSGEHTFVTIEKRGLTTLEAVRRLGREFSVPERDIGYAGMKDSVGVTRQNISIPRLDPENLLGRVIGGVKILAARRHGNKLKLGHLKGNAFRLVIRGVAGNAAEYAEAALDVLSMRGVPNWFGGQRYGAQGNSHRIGAAMLRRDWRKAVDSLIGDAQSVRDTEWQSAISAYHRGDLVGAARLMPGHCRSEKIVLQRLAARPDAYDKAFFALDLRLRKLYLSAFQSFLFDQILEQRLPQLDHVLDGDLAMKHSNAACFLVENAIVEAPRAAALEISATGPLFGMRMKPAGGGCGCWRNKFWLGRGCSRSRSMWVVGCVWMGSGGHCEFLCNPLPAKSMATRWCLSSLYPKVVMPPQWSAKSQKTSEAAVSTNIHKGNIDVSDHAD